MLPRLAASGKGPQWDADVQDTNKTTRTLFQMPQRRIKAFQARVSRGLARSSQSGLGVIISTQIYQHIAVAIAKRHLRISPKATTDELQALGALRESIFARQAGHQSAVHRQIYAVNTATPSGLTPERMEAFRDASKAWQAFVLDNNALDVWQS
ncbi:hypothetical protein BJX64DRAFT_295561 [Aspergillus heterothallicus]